jgi:ribonucleoside-diphosphate reductase alpha chain
MSNVIEFSRDKDTRDIMSDAKFYEGYSRWNDDKGRYETWNEAVERVMNTHREFYKNKMTPELESLINEAEELYKQKYFLGAQRALQFGGDQLLKNHMKLYNCTSSYADRTEFFGEYFWILLSGCGAGFSVQHHHIAKLANIQNRTKSSKIQVIEDSIEGWAEAVDVLLSSYFVGGGKHPEFEGRRVYFDTSLIRPKGSKISGGFKAPGPEPLRRALDKIEYLLQGLVLKGETKLASINVYDICMHIADAVISGGVRRAATICLFSIDDEEMMSAKTGNWFAENPQRARSNNSAVIVKNTATYEQFDYIMQKVKQFGEPGFVFVESTEHATNPCVEIGMFPQYIDENKVSHSGWQGCNLAEINGAKANSKEEFYKSIRGAAIVATLQAGYTNFKFVSEVTRKIFEREALLGVSITGWMNNPHVLLNEEVLKEGAELVKTINKQVAKLIGINPAARTTCVKPAGNASVILKTASGVHGEHSPRYIRNVQMNKDTEVAQLIRKTNPYMVEESVWSAGRTDYVISFPVIAPMSSVFRKDLYGLNLLEKVKLIQNSWVEFGTDEALCVDPTVRHNVSNTISVLPDQWEEVGKYIFDNRKSFAGVSLMSASGDRDYNQAPNTEVLTEQEIVKKYGRGAMFASGLIVDTFKGFNDLWEACTIAQMPVDYGDKEKSDVRAEWIRRYRKFAESYFDGDLKKTEHCLKDVHLLHRWAKIQQHFVNIDFVDELEEKKYIDIDTMGSAACVGTKDGMGCAI